MKMKGEKDLSALIREAESLAQKLSDGHLSIFRFTNGWKVAMGTPILEPGWPHDDYLFEIPAHRKLEDAINDFLDKQHKFPNEGDY